MSTKTSEVRPKKKTPVRPKPRAGKRPAGTGTNAGVVWTVIGVVVILVALAAIFYSSNGGRVEGTGKAGEYKFVVADPGPGQPAPDLRLPSAQGEGFDLARFEGDTVLLYFQEGIMCQPCWDQIKDIEGSMNRFEEIGVDQVATITTDPLDALEQKVADEGLTTPVLSDADGTVSQQWGTAGVGMMGPGMNGHSFILVGKDGTIEWRADYGGPPDYTMYLPVSNLLADMRSGMDESGS